MPKKRSKRELDRKLALVTLLMLVIAASAILLSSYSNRSSPTGAVAGTDERWTYEYFFNGSHTTAPEEGAPGEGGTALPESSEGATEASILFAGGSGTQQDPYQITNCSELQAMQDNVTAFYVLNNDIYCAETRTWNNGKGFDPVGNSDFGIDSLFQGALDGANHTIYELYINRPDEDAVGLFGEVYNSNFPGELRGVHNLGLEAVDITGKNSVGGLAGVFAGPDTKVSQCFVKGRIVGTGGSVGGMFGEATSGAAVEDSYFIGTVQGNGITGGLAGLKSAESVLNSYSVADVYGGSEVGGLFGAHDEGDTQNCFTNSDVSGTAKVGGLVGAYNEGTVTNSYWNNKSTQWNPLNCCPPSSWSKSTSAGSRYWGPIASSSDGTKLAAAGDGYIYTSTDSGATWTARTGSGYTVWTSIASSSDGTKLVAATASSRIYTSTDSGVTWTMGTELYPGTLQGASIASSSDGTKLAAAGDGYIYTSTDSGATWTARIDPVSRYSRSIASSSDGTKLAAVDGYIHTSTDGGATWTARTGAGYRSWGPIASSSDGTKLAAADLYGYIYTSQDSGATWTARTGAGSRYWHSIASSSDGTKLAAAPYNDYIYTSANGGATWTAQLDAGSRVWESIASSSDGTKLAAAASPGYIYTSTPSFPQLDCTAIPNNASYFKGADVDTRPPFSSWDFIHSPGVWVATSSYPAFPWSTSTAGCVAPSDCPASMKCCSDGTCESTYSGAGFYVSNISNLSQQASVLVSNDNFFTWQDLVLKATMSSPPAGLSVGAVFTKSFKFIIYNSAFDTSNLASAPGSQEPYFDSNRTRYVPSYCVTNTKGQINCTVWGECVKTGDSSADCTAVLNHTVTRLNDRINVKDACGNTVAYPSDVYLGSCPYDSICKGTTRAEDAYWNHNPLGKGYDDSAMNNYRAHHPLLDITPLWSSPSPYVVTITAPTAKSCELFEVCTPKLDKYVDEAEQNCVASGSSEGKYKECLKNYTIKTGLGPYTPSGCFLGVWPCWGPLVGKWMQGYWDQEIQYYYVVKAGGSPTPADCTAGGAYSLLNSRASFFQESGRAEPTWDSDTVYTQNNCYQYDLPAHVDVDIINTGICADYSIALTSLLRKMGYARGEIYSVNAPSHAFNIVKENTGKFRVVDTTGNKPQSTVVPSWPAPPVGTYGYYCFIEGSLKDESEELSQSSTSGLGILNSITLPPPGCDCTGKRRQWGLGPYSKGAFLAASICCDIDKGVSYDKYGHPESCCTTTAGSNHWGRPGSGYGMGEPNAMALCCPASATVTWDVTGKPITCCPESGAFNSFKQGRPGSIYGPGGSNAISICCWGGTEAVWDADGSIRDWWEGAMYWSPPLIGPTRPNSYPFVPGYVKNNACCQPSNLFWGTGPYAQTGATPMSICCATTSPTITYDVAGRPLKCS